MKDLHEAEFVRDYNVSVARLWAAVTEPGEIIQWFGPEGVELKDCVMNFSQLGPWTCTMRGLDTGQLFKVSGVVTLVNPPASKSPGSVGFSWAWHDDDDKRGAESHVTFTVSETATGARLVLHHRNLPDLEAAQSHSRGWLSTLNKLDRMLG